MSETILACGVLLMTFVSLSEASKSLPTTLERLWAEV